MTVKSSDKASQDPSYYDPTNPASPFYDPTLDPNSSASVNARAATSSSSIPVSSSPVVPVSSLYSNDNQNTEAVAFDKASRRKRRRMGNVEGEQLQQSLINATQNTQVAQTKPISKSDRSVRRK